MLDPDFQFVAVLLMLGAVIFISWFVGAGGRKRHDYWKDVHKEEDHGE